MKTRDIACWRMHSQHLWGSPLETLTAVVHRLCAMQAQEFHYAKWAVAQRARSVSDAAMDRAFADGIILRTHLLRPTWHFVLPADIRWLLTVTAPRVNASSAYYYRKLELDDKLFRKTNALIAKALQGGTHLTRKELAAVLEQKGITASALRLSYIMMRAELEAVVCSGAPRGKQQTYALLEERAPKAKVLGADEALAELTRRYFTSRGPATLKDFTRWSSLTAALGKKGLEMVGSDLEQEEIGGRTYWFAEQPARTKSARKLIDLIQIYDEIVMSYSESRDVLTPDVPQSAISVTDPPAGMHAVLCDGRLIGHWRLESKSNIAALETSFYRPLDGSETRALAAAVERFGRFRAAGVTMA